jgi:hypothetical protein
MCIESGIYHVVVDVPFHALCQVPAQGTSEAAARRTPDVILR